MEKNDFMSYMIDEYFPEESLKADIIIGPRLDSSYNTIVDDTLKEKISINTFKEAMIIGDLDKQVFIKSEKAHSNLKYNGYEKMSSQEVYDNAKEKEERDEYSYITLLSQKSQ